MVSFGFVWGINNSKNAVLHCSWSQFYAATYIRRCQYNFSRGIASPFKCQTHETWLCLLVLFLVLVLAMHSHNSHPFRSEFVLLFIHAKLVIENSTFFLLAVLGPRKTSTTFIFIVYLLLFLIRFCGYVHCMHCVCMSYTHIRLQAVEKETRWKS